MAWTDGRSQWAMVTNHSFGGSQCVGLRSLIVPLKPDDDAFARNQAANILLAMTPERQTDVPFRPDRDWRRNLDVDGSSPSGFDMAAT